MLLLRLCREGEEEKPRKQHIRDHFLGFWEANAGDVLEMFTRRKRSKMEYGFEGVCLLTSK